MESDGQPAKEMTKSTIASRVEYSDDDDDDVEGDDEVIDLANEDDDVDMVEDKRGQFCCTSKPFFVLTKWTL